MSSFDGQEWRRYCKCVAFGRVSAGVCESVCPNYSVNVPSADGGAKRGGSDGYITS